MWTNHRFVLLGLVLLVQAAHGNQGLSFDAATQTQTFELTLTWELHAPDGFAREMILTNGQFPGPVLEINQGDEVEVLVHNKLPFNTTLHYHGIEMYKTPWSDGVPGLSQRSIQPGRSFLYKWTATQFGTFWYHAHKRGQQDDGMYGPILIHPKPNTKNPFGLISKDAAAMRGLEQAEAHVIPLVLSDWRHVTSMEGWDIDIASGIETPCYDSLLFNGKGRVNCWSADKIASLVGPAQQGFLDAAKESKLTAKACLSSSVIGKVLAAGLPTNLSAIPPGIFDVCTPSNTANEVIHVNKSGNTSETWVALDVIATFGLIAGSFSIDEHPMYVYAVDGDYITPQRVEVVPINNGDRYSIMIRLDRPGDYTIRMASTAAAQLITGVATLSYHDPNGLPPNSKPSKGYIDDSGMNTTASVTFFDQNRMKSFPPDTVSKTVSQTFKFDIRVAGQSYMWALNSSIFPATKDDVVTPLLFDPHPALHATAGDNVTLSTLNGTWVDLIFQTTSANMPPHPIHKHGNKMYLLGMGDGMFNYTTVADAARAMPQSFNLVDPPKRDGFTTPAGPTGPIWMVVRYQVTNPGAWLLHCHVQSHLQGGMSIAILDGVDAWPKVPQEYIDYR